MQATLVFELLHVLFNSTSREMLKTAFRIVQDLQQMQVNCWLLNGSNFKLSQRCRLIAPASESLHSESFRGLQYLV